MAVDLEAARAAMRAFLVAVGEDPDRPGLMETPDRVARAAAELLSGYDEDPAAHLRKQFQESGNEEMVIVRDIPFSSLCEHHILPFTGRAIDIRIGAAAASRAFPRSPAAWRAMRTACSCRSA